MRLPTFPSNDRKRWDYYNEFYCFHGGSENYSAKWAQFETGELICISKNFDPHERGWRDKLNVGVFHTNDKDMPNLTLKGEKVPKAWLDNSGSQVVLCDRDTGMVVALRSQNAHTSAWKDTWKRHLPSRFLNRACFAYFAGEGREPQGSTVIVWKPVELTPDQKAYLREFKLKCEMWKELNNPKHIYPNTPLSAKKVLTENLRLDTTEPSDILRVARFGYERWTERLETHDLMLQP